MGQISIRGTTHARLKAYAEQEGRPLSAILHEWICSYAPFTDKLPPPLPYTNRRKPAKAKSKAKVQPEKQVKKKAKSAPAPVPEPRKAKPAPEPRKAEPQPAPEPPQPEPAANEPEATPAEKPKHVSDARVRPSGLEPYRPKTPTGSGYGEF